MSSPSLTPTPTSTTPVASPVATTADTPSSSLTVVPSITVTLPSGDSSKDLSPEPSSSESLQEAGVWATPAASPTTNGPAPTTSSSVSAAIPSSGTPPQPTPNGSAIVFGDFSNAPLGAVSFAVVPEALRAMSSLVASASSESTPQPWFSEACADLAPPNIQVVANTSSDLAALTNAALEKAKLLWDVGTTLTYGYLPNESTPAQQKKIDDVIVPFIAQSVNLTFSKLDTTTAVPNVRISCSAGYGSWSYVGQSCKNVPSNRATMNLDGISDASLATSTETRTILHQLLHVLGMTHEFPASIKLAPKATQSFYSYSQGWSEAQVTSNILNVYNAGDVSNYAAVDQSSIMMYYMPAQLNQSNRAIPINAGPSTRDTAWLRLNYPGPDAAATLGVDLDALGVKGDTKVALLTAPLATVRSQIATWLVTQLASSTTSPGLTKLKSDTIRSALKLARDVAAPVAAPMAAAAAPEQTKSYPDIKASTGNFLDSIVKSLRQVFSPGGGQIFTLQFPGRFLQLSEYAWDTTSAGIYGRLIKPVAVNESEFRLVDQLYDVADVVSAPNGVFLSQAYEQLLNNLVPVPTNSSLTQLQGDIRRWLLAQVPVSPWVQQVIESQQASDPGDASATGTPVATMGMISRLELSNALMQNYLAAKQNWERERDQMMEDALKATDSAGSLASLSRKLAHTTETRKAQLAAKYTDAIVRGYTHNIREYVSYLDVKTTAETLQDAKDALREAAASSLDGSMKVYPVQLSPIDWFEGLSTSFTPEDLTTNADALVQQINSKSLQIDTLNQQLIALESGQKGSVDDLEAEVTKAQAAVDAKLTGLASTYTNNVIAMAKTCLDSKGDLDVDQLTSVGTELGISPEMIQQLGDAMGETAKAQQELTASSRAYARALADYALAQATDTKQQQEQIRQQVTSLTKEVDVLTARYQSLNQPGARPQPPPEEPTESLDKVDLLPPTNNSPGGSRWQDIVMHHIVQSDYSKQQDSASGSTTSMTCNLWIMSASAEVTTNSASASSTTSKMRNEVWVGLRATLVTIDRGGWFQPQFFKQSAGFYHISRGVTWSRWPGSAKTMNDIKAAGNSAFQVLNQGLLPAFPQAMIICKDITIKISNDSTSTETSKVNMQSMAAASGGVLCFSMASSDASSSSENMYSFKQYTNGCVIRIPGPQVLGYIMQLTDSDQTRDLPANLAGFFVPPVEPDLTPQHGIQAAAAPRAPVVAQGPLFERIDEILAETSLPARTVLDIRKAVQKELDVLSGDVAERIRAG